MVSSYFCHLRRFIFDQSSPAQPVLESRLSVEPERDTATVVVVEAGKFFGFLILDAVKSEFQ